MLFRGLKTKILFNLAILLLVAMALIDLVAVATAQKQLVRAEAGRGRLSIALVEQHLLNSFTYEELSRPAIIKKSLSQAVHLSGSSCAFFFDSLSGKTYRQGTDCSSRENLEQLVEDAALNGASDTRYDGTSWGVFWKSPRDMTLYAPINNGVIRLGGMALVFELEAVYAQLRKSHKFFMIYIAVNVVVLTLIGFYRISRLYLMPVHRMARRAEGYREDSGMPFVVRKEDNELKVLSKALNQMIRRITEDKEKLRNTVRSLESANNDLRHAQEEVVRAEKLSTGGRLASGIAHEIGNPIGIVLGYLQLLERSDVSEIEKQDYIERAQEEIHRISLIIRQLLDFSRPAQASPEAVSINAVIMEVADMLRVQPILSGIEFRVQARAEVDTVFADPNQLKQVLINIVLNAADAVAARREDRSIGRVTLASLLQAPSGTHSEMTADHRNPPMLVIECSDNGIGIAEDQLASVFDPFFTTKGPRQGTGLGLSVSYTLVEGMGGRLEVSSILNQGTTMSLHLPLYFPNSVDEKNCRFSPPGHSAESGWRKKVATDHEH